MKPLLVFPVSPVLPVVKALRFFNSPYHVLRTLMRNNLAQRMG